ncbi:Josephin-domain-containing protein [Leucosporidium creatinivorum]|uniref:Ataxin-3 homolog n=1 Tax=Leucosporidium creatinivorum TaxID=106004 RepID=A0A1Y2FKN5_9BASI|nr:Josephin-domain-containing protein [Leucosporidium creatinivorum]
MDAQFIKTIYHEKQEAGSMLCGQHALNNLLQESAFTAQDLADIARQLDALELQQLGVVEGAQLAGGESNNYDDSGFFSVEVLSKALEVLGLRLVRWKSQEMKYARDHPEQMEGFVLNHQLHWYSIRRFGRPERFYNLDSCIPQPSWISPTYLGLSLREAELQGYSIFAVVPADDSRVGGLPSCAASDLALTLPAPTSRGGDSSTSNAVASTSTSSFQGAGNVLGSKPATLPSISTNSSAAASASSSTTSTSTSKGKNKRPPVDDAMDEDDDLIIVGGSSTSGATSQARSTSSVEEESEKRRQRRRIGDRDLPVSSGSASPAPPEVKGQTQLTEDEQMALAIAESLRASKLETDADDDEEDEIVVVGDRKKEEVKGKGKAKDSSTSAPAPTSRARRGDEEEDAELAAALKASLLDAGGAGEREGSSSKEVEETEEDDGEDDTPSMEELRRRRLARFG